MHAAHSNNVARESEKSTDKTRPDAGGRREARAQNPIWRALARAGGGAVSGSASSDSSGARLTTGVAPRVQRSCAQCADESFGQVPRGGPANLTVGAPDDEYEREAEAVAERVMRMPVAAPEEEEETPLLQTKPLGAQRLQRACDACS
jgi:hypothetical protein